MTEKCGYDGWRNGTAFCACGSRFESMDRFERHIGMTPTPVPSEVAETTAGERDRTFLLPDDCDCLPPYADCTHPPAEPDAGEVQALAKVLWNASRTDEGTISAIGANHVAAAVLASDWLAALLDRVRREEGAKVLREAAAAWVPSAPNDPAGPWLRDRAASVGRGEGL